LDFNFKPKYRKKTCVDRKTVYTYGEFFADGSAIELVKHPTEAEELTLVHYDGGRSTLCRSVQRDDRVYVPAILDPTILRVLKFPTKGDLHDTSRQLLADISGILRQYSGLREPFISVAGRFVLATWLYGAIAAPRLSLVGPETTGGTNLFKILSCLSRHALPLTEIHLSAICSLPMKLGFTLMLRSPELGLGMERALAITQRREGYVLRKGRLHDLHFSLVTYCQFPATHIEHRIACLEIPIHSAHEQLPILDERVQQEIAASFQRRLLAYRFNNFVKARDSKLDFPQFSYGTRELAHTLGVCTPGDDLPEELLRLLEIWDTETQSTKWVDPNVAVVESLFAFCREGESRFKYVGDVTKEVNVILSRRGETREVKPKAVGRIMRLMGLPIEPRDSKGFKVERTTIFCDRVNLLVQELDVPPLIQNEKRKDLNA
jgi:hypothetical protein